MNNKITFQEFATSLAETTGVSKKVWEDFIRELISLVSESLTKGDSVKIKGFGTFKLVEIEERKSVNIATGQEIKIPVHSRVTFIPAKELSNTVNSPFANFETVELDDAVSDEELENFSNVSFEDEVEIPESFDKIDAFTGSQIYNPINEVKKVDDNSIDKESESEESKIEENGISDVDDNPDSDYNGEIIYPQKKFRFGWGFLTGFIVAVIICILALGFFDYYYDNSRFLNKIASKGEIKKELPVPTKDVSNPEEENSEDNILGNDVNTNPSDEVIYDTISTTRFLTTMAKEYYGNYNLWPYIYEENKSFLGHPDRIKPGTKVVIPSLKNLGIEPNDPLEIEKAKKMGVAIYAKYKK